MNITVTQTYQRISQLEGLGVRLADRVEKHYNKMFAQYKKYGMEDPYGFRMLPERLDLDQHDICTCIATNPYMLTEVRGISFQKADKIAQENFDFDRDDPRRHKAGNRYIVSRKGVLPSWQYARERQKLELRNEDYKHDGVILERQSVWLPEELEAEATIARFFESVTHTGTRDNSLLDVALRSAGAELNDEQRKAVRLGVSGVRCMALTGGAGCGKTHTLASIAKAAQAIGLTMRVMAFSGKAAMRAEEAMREGGAEFVECSTIHRALGLPHPFEEDSLAEEIIVLDEASMIPNWLMAAVIGRLSEQATLILVGDPNQLPPIGYGSPFQDYLELWLPHVHLVKNYRQANQQSIFQFAEAIRTQRPEDYTPAASGVHLHFGIDSDDETFFDNIIKSVEPLGLHEWQVITWTNNIQEALNIHIQGRINPHGERVFGYRCWNLKDGGRFTEADVRVGDKVLVTDNDYDYGIFNGQTGVIVDATYRQLKVDFGHVVVDIDIDDASDLLQLGYCITVHKSQGSGYEATILYQPFEVGFQPRRFYYTAATRAKNQVYMISTMSEREFWRNACQADNVAPSTLLGRVKMEAK